MKTSTFLLISLVVLVFSASWMPASCDWDSDTLLVEVYDGYPFLQSAILLTEPSSEDYQVKFVITTQTIYGVAEEDQNFNKTGDTINIIKYIVENDATCGETLIDTFSIGRLFDGNYTLILSLYDYNQFQLDSNIVNTSFILGGPVLTERTENIPDILLFPNPAHSSITLLAEDFNSIKNIRLVDSRGRILKLYPSSKKVLDLEGLSPGLYFIQLYTGTGIITRKIWVE